jgi:hypothetical protein
MYGYHKVKKGINTDTLSGRQKLIAAQDINTLKEFTNE